MVFDSIFERYFGIQLNNMKKGIEVTLSKETAHPCALLLSAYTEVMGGTISWMWNVKTAERILNFS